MRMLKGKPGLRLLLACYAGGLVLLVLAGLAGYAANRIAYANGGLQPAELTLEDFELEGLEQTGADTVVSTDNDPKLYLKDAQRRVESLVLEVEHSRPSLHVQVYWAQPGQGYLLDNMAAGQNEGRLFWLPAVGGQALRIDPSAVAGDVMVVRRIAINQPRPFWAFFVPQAGQAVCLAVVPGLAACLLHIIKDAGLWPRRRKAVAPGE